MYDEEFLNKVYQLNSSITNYHRLLHIYLMKTSKVSLTWAQLFLLQILKEDGPSNPSTIAGKMGVTLGAITSLADKLVNQGLISRERSSDDRRRVKISLTKEGEELYQEAVHEYARNIVRVLSVLSLEEVEAMKAVYQKLTKNLNEIIDREK